MYEKTYCRRHTNCNVNVKIIDVIKGFVPRYRIILLECYHIKEVSAEYLKKHRKARCYDCHPLPYDPHPKYEAKQSEAKQR